MSGKSHESLKIWGYVRSSEVRRGGAATFYPPRRGGSEDEIHQLSRFGSTNHSSLFRPIGLTFARPAVCAVLTLLGSFSLIAQLPLLRQGVSRTVSWPAQ